MKAKKFYYAQDKTKAPWGTVRYFVQVCQTKNEIRDLDETALRMVGNDLLEKVFPEANGEDKVHFQSILLALFRSVRREHLSKIINTDSPQLDLIKRNEFDALMRIKPKECSSPVPEVSIPAKFRFYENCFLKRSLIQNYDWGFAKLDEGVDIFIKNYEKSKLYFKAYTKTKWKGKKCLVCHETCVTRGDEICDYCYDYKRLKMFIKISTCFKLLGNMYLFFWYLPKVTEGYLFTYWKRLNSILSRESPINIILDYAVYSEIRKLSFDSLNPQLKKKKFLLKKRSVPHDELDLVKLKDDDAEVESLGGLGQNTLI